MLDGSAALIDWLAEERRRQGITQKQLADLTGIKQPMIARIESKRACPTVDTLCSWAQALGCSLSFTKDAG